MNSMTVSGGGVTLDRIPVYDIESVLVDESWVRCPECGQTKHVETGGVNVVMAGKYRDTTFELHICTDCKTSWFVMGTGERE